MAVQTHDQTNSFIALPPLRTDEGARWGCSEIMKLNASEFMALPHRIGGIHKYSSKDHRWSQFYLLRYTFPFGRQCTIYDKTTNGIFVAHGGSDFMFVDLMTGRKTKYDAHREDYAQRMVLIGDKIHIFGIASIFATDLTESRLLHHRIFDTVSGRSILKSMASFTGKCGVIEFSGYDLHDALFCKSRESILIGCTFSSRNGEDDCSVLIEYSSNTQQYRKLEWSVTTNVVTRAMVSTLNERYIVVFGGWRRRSGYNDDILVYDLQSESVAVSDIKCPFAAEYEAVLLGSNEQDELATFGYIREAIRSSELNDDQKMPVHVHVIRFLCSWYCNETVHLIVKENGSHWKIDMDKVINSVSRK